MAGAAVLSLVGTGMADAAYITYDLRSGSSTASSSSGSGFGNSFTFTAGGVTVKVTGYSLATLSSSFQTAQVLRYSTGLGVCNQTEGSNCGSPRHQVDNVNGFDFVLFEFSAAVDPYWITIDPYGSYDRDVSYWVGTTAGPLGLAGQNIAGLGALGFGGRTDDSGTQSDSSRNVSVGGGVVNAILFGAAATGTDKDDYFKIRAIKVDYEEPPGDQIPEPTVLALLGAALAGVAAKRRAA